MTGERSPLDRPFTRRGFIIGAASAGAGIAVGAAGAAAADRIGSDDGTPARDTTIPFYGEHQAGIATPMQDRLHVAAFDLATPSRAAVIDLLQRWSAAAARLCAGETSQPLEDDPVPTPADTGEALDLAPSRLTITFGLGGTLFEKDGVDRYGIASRRPAALADLPPFPGDVLDPALSGGDLIMQACADNAQVAYHAVRNLARIAHDVAVMRWQQQGFISPPADAPSSNTPRNLMGFKDGTNNIDARDEAVMRDVVWVGDEGPGWMRGGSYMVARRVRMRIEAWDRDSLGDQEARVGRHKISGAPIGSADEFAPLDLEVTQDGRPRIPVDAHIRLANHATNGGIRILRRGYNFMDGIDAIGDQDAGLFFIAYQRDPHAQFVPIQQRLAESDALNLYLFPTSSSLFAIPPGVVDGAYVASALFEP
jgi:deferrochelatase/peroxidase EfeB